MYNRVIKCIDTGEVVYSYPEYLKTKHWKKVRKSKLSKIKCCEKCRSKIKLHVHHKHYKTIGNETGFELQVLCELCHNTTHGYKHESKKKHKSKKIKQKKLTQKITVIVKDECGNILRIDTCNNPTKKTGTKKQKYKKEVPTVKISKKGNKKLYTLYRYNKKHS